MAVIVPFRGVRYNEKVTGKLADVIAPPYDVITAEEQEQLYLQSPYNLIRLEYGKGFSGERAGDNRYTRAAADLKSWLQEKALLPEQRRSFYIYRQTFTVLGRTLHRTGLIAALKLEPYSSRVVLPHEDTLAAPKKDRMDLLRSCRANFSPIFGLFSDPEENFAGICNDVLQEKPLFHFDGGRGETHTLWAIQGKEIEAPAALLAPKQIFIADGHHRYDTALQYAQEAGGDRSPGSRYVLAVLVPLEDPGLVVLPFHRLLAALRPQQLELLSENVERYFETAERGLLKELHMARFTAEIASRGKESPSMGLLLPRGAQLLTLKYKTGSGELDVSILKRLLLDPVLAGAACPEDHLDFVIDEEDAQNAVLTGEAQAALLLNPTPMEAVTERALKGENMPQKSTCFYPKLPSGLVIHHLDLSHSDAEPF